MTVGVSTNCKHILHTEWNGIGVGIGMDLPDKESSRSAPAPKTSIVGEEQKKLKKERRAKMVERR